MQAIDHEKWLKERDAVLFTHDVKEFRKFYAKYQELGLYSLPLPKDDRIVRASMEKSILAMASAPPKHRGVAKAWLKENGFSRREQVSLAKSSDHSSSYPPKKKKRRGRMVKKKTILAIRQRGANPWLVLEQGELSFPLAELPTDDSVALLREFFSGDGITTFIRNLNDEEDDDE